jgi:cation-transporting ATPase E
MASCRPAGERQTRDRLVQKGGQDTRGQVGATAMTQTKLSGLSPEEVAERTARGQVNRVRRSDRAEYLDIAARNTLTLFNALVVPAAAALFALGEYRGALAVSGMAVTNMVLGLVQEVRAKRHLDRLALLSEARARVVRGGQVGDVPSGDVVLGDHLLLAAGEPVVADGPVLEARFLEVDEALLTGESDPVPRRPGEPLLSGSFCVAGEGCYRADRVGAEAFAQRTAAEARAYRYAASPLQESIDRLIRILTWTAVTLCAGYVVLYYTRGFSQADLVEMIAATVTSMVPQGLVLMTTLAFTLGAVRMSRRGALVQRLNAVESMAGVDTLCMDKTGTLTTNNLRLERLEVVDPSLSGEEVRARLRLFASASLDRSSKSLAALRAALGEGEAELLDQLPFKSQNRYSAVRVRPRQPPGPAEYVLALGACEALQPYLAQDTAGTWEAVWSKLLGSGLRILLFARADTGRPQFDGSLDGFVLRPLALVALSDELRPEAGAVLRALAEQGIGFKVLSGDNPATVRATVAALGAGAAPAALRALAESPVVTGAELEKSAHAGELIRTRAVFGRVSPWQKVEIVRTLRAQGRHVAMLGDGVNDVLPIKNAHLGIAMGEGARASKTVAGLVLQTNDFGLLPEALEEGRTILRNLRRAGKLFLTKNAFTLILIVGALGVFGLPFPFLPQQVTLLNFLTIGVPAFLITLSRGRSAAPSRPGFVREVGGFALRTGAVIGAAGLVAMLLAPRWAEVPRRATAVTGGASTAGLLATPGGPGPLLAASAVLAEGTVRQVQTQRTVLLSILVLLGLTTLLRVLTDGEVGWRPGDRKFVWLTLAAVSVYLAALYWPPAAYFFELTPLSMGQWVRVVTVVAPAYGVMWASDRLLAGSPLPLGPRRAP